MGATLPADFAFEPKVWKDHIKAYFDRKMILGQFAARDDTLVAEPGTKVDMPFFKKIGDAEEPGVDEALTVDKLQDDSFQAIVKESGKALGVRKSAIRKGAAKRDRVYGEAQRQMARVMAEKVDRDLLAELQLAGNFVAGFTATAAAQVMTVGNLLSGKITAFGDKHNQAIAVVMHSLSFLSMMKDSTTGFLKAEATDPMWKWGRFDAQDPQAVSFEGRILGMAIFTIDTLTQNADIDSKKAWPAFILKAQPYGLMVAQEMDLDADKDILNREVVFATTQEHAVKSFHAKAADDDLRVAKMIVTTEVAA